MVTPKTRLLVFVLCLVIAAPGIVAAAPASRSAQLSAPQRFRLVARESKFIAHAQPGGLLWFKGHEHLVAAREFSGEATFTPDKLATASLALTVRTESLVETSAAFTTAQQEIINRELRELVLEPDKYPEITFRSTAVTGKALGNGAYELRIAGDLTLHGVTRRIEIPTKVMLTGNTLRARGEFSIDRSHFKVNATSAFHGLVRVRKRVKFTFDIVGQQL
jgi:polyisoprenoid-binding protein YceI